MGGTSTSNSQTEQSSTSAPWRPSQGILQVGLKNLEGQYSNINPTGAENSAFDTLSNNAQNMPNYAPQATSLSNDLMSGGGTAQNAGILSSAYQNYQNQLNPIANQSNDPMQAPGMSALLDTIKNDVGNSVNGMFAGAGRDLSGMNQQTLARGMSQGMAAPLLAQYNQNVQNQMGAAGNLFNAGGQTASGLQGFNQQGFDNRAQGLDTAINGIPAAQNAGAYATLNAEAQRRGLPVQNLAQLLGLTLPIAGLGSETTGKGSTSGSQTMSGAQQFATIAGGVQNLMPKFPMKFG